jgi:hypothetical protein
MEMLIIFIVLTILNVVIQTIKSIATIKCGKVVASLVNAVAYGLYTYVIFFTSADGIDLHAKAMITAFANLVGVYVVKYFEEKARKDKIWKIECSVPVERVQIVKNWLKARKLPFNYIEDIGNYTIFNIYCYTQEDSTKAKGVVEHFQLKYFVSESKTL